MKQNSMLKRKLFAFFIAISVFANAQLITETNKFERYYIPAQSVSNHYTMWTSGVWRINSYKNIELNQEHGILKKEVVQIKLKKKGQRSIEKRRTIKKYDINGRLVEEQKFSRGREKKHFQLSYNQSGFFSNYKEMIRGKYRKSEELKYNKDNNVVLYKRFDKKGLDSKWEAQYKDTLLLSQWSYRLKKEDTTEVISKWEYEYYPTKEKKQTKYYKKGELKHTWLYSCDEEGKEVKPKDETKVCEIKQYNNDGTYILVQRNTGKKGKITKTRLTYNAKDLLIMREFINVKGKITYKQSYKYNDNGKQIAWYYYKRGKHSDIIRYGKEYDYNSEDKLLEQRYIGKKGMYGKNVFVYNTNGLRESSVYIDSKKGQESSYKYKYDEKDLLVKTERYNKKGILVWMYMTEYEYD